MFKSIIAPMQAWLLSQGRCVGCGTELSEGKKKATKYGEQVTCAKCGRIFIHDVKTNKYRRALLEEVD
jgi:predicted  nucleic acid-binding Zn-ribbon protein